MHLDMASAESVRSFVQQVSQKFDRIDGIVANAGIMIDQWSQTEGMETSMTVNVVNTLFLGALMIPVLSGMARKFSIQPTIVFIVSVLGYTAKAEMDKSRQGSVWGGLNDEKKANMDQRYGTALSHRSIKVCGRLTLLDRYPLTKLVEEFAVRQLSALAPVDRTGVVINMVAPGLCSTALGKDARTFTRIMHESIKAMMARTPEVGSRTILHGLVAGPESHGKLLSGCKIKEYWVPDWVTNPEGQALQKNIWKELANMLDQRQSGAVAQLSSV